MVKLQDILKEFLKESAAADEAKRLGLDYLHFGRWGKDGKVTHIAKDGKLVPVSSTDSPDVMDQ